MSADEMNRTCDTFSFLGVAKLRDYKLSFTRYSKNREGGVADIVRSPGDSVMGTLYEIDDACLDQLDIKEGLGKAYRRIQVQVNYDDEVYDAQTYEVIDKSPNHIPPSDLYLDIILQGATEKNFPSEYRKFLENFRQKSHK